MISIQTSSQNESTLKKPFEGNGARDELLPLTSPNNEIE